MEETLPRRCSHQNLSRGSLSRLIANGSLFVRFAKKRLPLHSPGSTVNDDATGQVSVCVVFEGRGPGNRPRKQPGLRYMGIRLERRGQGFIFHSTGRFANHFSFCWTCFCVAVQACQVAI